LEAKNCHTEETKERAGRQNFCWISKYSNEEVTELTHQSSYTYCHQPLKHWDYGFESLSSHRHNAHFSCACVVMGMYRPFDGLLPPSAKPNP